MRYTPWVASEHVPDFSTLERIVASPRFAGLKGQELAIALWELMVDRELGIFHYFPAMEMLWGKDVYDPLKTLNVYGFTICHCHANILAMLFRAAGFESRVATIRGHEGTEVYYDDNWHYFDCDLQMFYRRRPPEEGVIASREDLYRDSSLVVDQPYATPPHHIPDRLPEDIRKLYEVEPTYPDLMDEQVHGMDFRLRPGEEMLRYFHNRGRWVVFPHYPECFARYQKETSWEGPTERFWPRRQWGNGFFLYEPRLEPGSRDLEFGAEEVAGLAIGEGGLGLASGETAGHAIFAFESPYIYCGVPDPARRLPSVEGAILDGLFDLPEGASARIEGAPERGGDWRELWSASGGSELPCRIDFTELAEARYRMRLRVVLEGPGAVLRRFRTQMWFMVSPHSLPALRKTGANKMSLRSGDRFGLRTRPLMMEEMLDDPRAVERAHSTANLRHEPGSWERVLPVDPARPWEIVYELAAPEGKGGRMAWLRAYALFEGRKPDEPADDIPARIEIADSPEGPWRTIAEREIVEHPQGWHFGARGEGRFSLENERGYIRFSARRGAKGFRVMSHYVPEGADAPTLPLEIEHAWYEDDPRVGRRLRRHVETIAAEDHEYAVFCANAPNDDYVRLRVKST